MRKRRYARALYVQEQQARCIPEFVGKCPTRLYAILLERNIGARTSRNQQRYTNRVGSETINKLERIDYVALGFRDLLPLRVTDEAMEVHFTEWNIARAFETQHDHPRDPEE